MSDSSPPRAVPLGRAEIVELAGADALAFAQAQFSSDVGALDDGEWQLAAWLTAQGRARAVFVLMRFAADRLVAWLPLGDAAAFRDGLARYVFRSKVVLRVVDGWAFSRLEGGAIAIGKHRLEQNGEGVALAMADGRLARLHPDDGAIHDDDALREWRRADIDAGLPWIDRATQDAFVPQALSLDTLAAVRFDKGCYPGQEIAARLHFRGGNKEHLHRVRVASDASDVEPGARVRDASSANVGTILYAARRDDAAFDALAVIGDAAVESALSIEDGAPVFINKDA